MARHDPEPFRGQGSPSEEVRSHNGRLRGPLRKLAQQLRHTAAHALKPWPGPARGHMDLSALGL